MLAFRQIHHSRNKNYYKYALINSYKEAAVVDLGTGTSFDVTSYSGYEDFTEDDFIVEPVSFSAVAGSNSGYNEGRGAATASGSLVKTYSSGTLTAYQYITTSLSCGSATAWTGSSKVSVHAYLIR